ncbi:2979_t:CDS:2 [Rhizophagus irregularis]|nr:2979_t:CDS:2 [Rhizophagus irregularis]
MLTVRNKSAYNTESDLSNLNVIFSSALKDWNVLELSAEKCLKSLLKMNNVDLSVSIFWVNISFSFKLNSYQLRTIRETV